MTPSHTIPFNRHRQSYIPAKQALDQLDPISQERVKKLLEQARNAAEPADQLALTEQAWFQSAWNLEIGLPLIELAQAQENWELLEEVARISRRFTGMDTPERAVFATRIYLAETRQPRKHPGMNLLGRTLLAHAAWNRGRDLKETQHAAGLKYGPGISWLLAQGAEPGSYEYRAGL